MDVYVYEAALYCVGCGEGLREGKEPDEDSNHYPQGPYLDGGGEADCPQHCDACGEFLENPLTPDGVAYVMTSRRTATSIMWRKFYNIAGRQRQAVQQDCEEG